MKVVTISDSHCQLNKVTLPEGDILLHAGDLTFSGNTKEIASELNILGNMAKKFLYGCYFVCGNHDWMGEKDPSLLRLLAKENGLTWLQNESATVDGIKIYGSGNSLEFNGWALPISAYDGTAKECWDKIPDDTNILITHGPPKGIGDLTLGYQNVTPCSIEYDPPKHVGDLDLLDKINTLKNCWLHVYGHIHSGYGIRKIGNVTHANASIVNERYQVVNAPHVIDL